MKQKQINATRTQKVIETIKEMKQSVKSSHENDQKLAEIQKKKKELDETRKNINEVLFLFLLFLI